MLLLPEEHFLLFCVFVQGKAPAPDFRDLRDDHETVGVNITGQPLNFRHFVVGNNAQNDLRLLMQVAACAVQES